VKERKKLPEGDVSSALTRRGFIKATGVVVLGAGAGVAIVGCGSDRTPVCAFTVPPSEGYLLVDTKKCQGCLTCMLACSLVHEGKTSLSLSRIQILQDAFARWPEDVSLEVCRQCVEPVCVLACPTGALTADREFGFVRRVCAERCIGCGRCVQACPQNPSRVLVAADDAFGGRAKSRKCDLCADTPYHWDPAGGGPHGKQACVEVCPVGAIAFTREIPEQSGDAGYGVNLRGAGWAKLGFPTDD